MQVYMKLDYMNSIQNQQFIFLRTKIITIFKGQS